VLLLPHGHEGQGPDHSTARPERFLQLAAETNLRLANPTTAAQYFHLLRRQALLLTVDPLPLIVLTPKSLLRHKLAMSTLNDLTTGQWQPVIDDETVGERRDTIRRLVLCSGKVYVDLMTTEHRPNDPEIAIVRVEQLYRVPVEEIAAVLAEYPNLEEVVWLQEEPQNMGAWSHLQPFLEAIIDRRQPLRYVGRPRRASPAEGFASWHKVNQDELMRQAYLL
jgi:2-oxoglutarate dehydrogenase E1 component